LDFKNPLFEFSSKILNKRIASLNKFKRRTSKGKENNEKK